MSFSALAAVLTVALAPDLTLKLEAGTELDSNVHRTTSEGSSPVAAVGARLGGRLAAGVRTSERSLLRLSALAAGKLFGEPDAQSASVGVLAADARFDVAVGAFAPGLRASYYEAEEAASTGGQDFRTGQAAASLTLRAAGDHRIEASAGARFFVYKPDADFDFTGAQLGLTVSRRLRLGDGSDELAYSAGYTLSQRAYAGPALANVCRDGAPITPTCLYVTSHGRADLFHDAAVEVTYTRSYILGARYGLQINDSNSFGQSLLRHRLELSATAELGWDVFLNVKGVLIVTQFPDALLLGGDVGTFTTIEDDARNAVVLHLTRDVGERLTVEARYAFYANPFSGQELAYRRHTGYLGLVYAIGK